jgi:hypothetical protein
MSDDDKLKVIEGNFREKHSMMPASDVLKAAADYMTTKEDEEGVEAEVIIIIQMKGEPSLPCSNVEPNRMTTLLDFAKWDLITAMVNEEYAEVYGEDDDDTVH